MLAGNLHPHYRETIETVSRMAGARDRGAAAGTCGQGGAGRADRRRRCRAWSCRRRTSTAICTISAELAEQAHAAGALLIAVVTEVVSLGLVQPPGAMGADIVVGEGQSIGNALSFGGPYVGLFATRQKYVRQMPGRLCGETVDKEGRRGFVLTLSTREQHIRREKATSNICTNSGLCVLAFTIHMTLLGEAGLRRLARINHANAVALAERAGQGARASRCSTTPSSTSSRSACRAMRPR